MANKLQVLQALNIMIRRYFISDVDIDTTSTSMFEPVCKLYFSYTTCNYCPFSRGNYKGCKDDESYINLLTNLKRLNKCNPNSTQYFNIKNEVNMAREARLAFLQKVYNVCKDTDTKLFYKGSQHKFPRIYEQLKNDTDEEQD